MGTVITIIVIVVVVAAAIVAAYAYKRRRSDQLQQRFGPEYERTIEESGDRKAAERDLRQREQRIQFVFRKHEHVALHLEVKLTAQLGARELILADPVGGKVDLDLHARNEVLFEAQLRYPEVVNHVFRSQAQLDRTIDWNRERGSD